MLRGDQIEVFKALNGYENIDRNIMFASLRKTEIEEDMIVTANRMITCNCIFFSWFISH